ncbi:hypothetical protein BJY04DRAFT_182124, partial [Aspergillus karnatakaensis]|uniref:WKF domain-containing protein n=1 Tax=Aspergillus karnatakaensis TaxID=1810916 RepID=UPI003CCCE8F1
MAEEKKSRSKRLSSKTKRSGETEADTEVNTNRPDIEQSENTEDADKDKIASQKKERQGKKRRLGDEVQDGQTALVNEEKEDSEHKKKKKKKVAFSAKNEAKSPSPMEEEEAAEADDETGRTSKNEKKKKTKKEKKTKQAAVYSNGSTNDDSATAAPKNGDSAILSYLDLYHNDRSAWKFQKIREIQLFKHILSLEHVPAHYEAALLSYLQGLKGEAAKQRLREVAQAAVKANVEETKPDVSTESSSNLSDEQAEPPTTTYRKAVYAFRTKLTESGLPEDLGESFEGLEQLDAELLDKFRKRRRAEVILFALDGRVFTMSNLKAPPQKGKNAAQSQPANKKKKNRTAFVEISSSSESDSEGEGNKKPAQSQPDKNQAAKKKKKSRTAVVDMSSSSA